MKLFPLVGLFIINSVFSGFYSEFEPRYMLNPHNKPLRELLSEKIRYSVKIVIFTNLPVLTINSMFQQDMVTANVLYLFGFVILITGMIYLKYAGYEPCEQLRAGADSMFLALSVIVPYLIPLGIVISMNAKRKALVNLKTFYHD